MQGAAFTHTPKCVYRIDMSHQSSLIEINDLFLFLGSHTFCPKINWLALMSHCAMTTWELGATAATVT